MAQKRPPKSPSAIRASSCAFCFSSRVVRASSRVFCVSSRAIKRGRELNRIVTAALGYVGVVAQANGHTPGVNVTSVVAGGDGS